MAAERSRIASVVDQYLDAVKNQDFDGILSLFAPVHASVEDPIGSTPKTGDAVRAFYSIPRDVQYLERVGPIAIRGDYAGFAFRIDIGRPEGVVKIHIHETMRFDDDGLIVSMVALPDFELVDAAATAVT